MRLSLLVRVLLGAGLALPTTARGEDYPSKPVRIVVPFLPGGGADRLARLLAEKLRQKWGQPVIVDNRAGAGGNIGADSVFRAAPDGYTLLFGTPGPVVINKMLYPKLTYDSDVFVPISHLTISPNALVVHPNVPAKDVRQLIAYARAHPGRLNYASAGIGTTPHLTGELLKSRAGIDIVHIPYKGSTLVLTDLVGGRVDMAFFLLSNVLQQARAGRVRLVAVTSTRRTAMLPDVPAVAEVLPGFVSIQWIAAVGPPGMPPAIANRLQSELAEVMKQNDVAKHLLEQGDEPVASTPAALAALIRSERELWGAVIRSTGATAQD
jgi:tripartite-type tricarboxylate transporter receptor subunit TctC